MKDSNHTPLTLAAAMTKSASLQTYLTIRWLVDRDRVQDAYRAYAYFRWVDDVIDGQYSQSAQEEVDDTRVVAFVERQKALLSGEQCDDLWDEERMLADLISSEHGKDPGLQSYLHNMMGVMEFDARRRGGVISHAELEAYSGMLATAVTDGLYYFIDHDVPAPDHPSRYLAVTAAHITHMLRDTREDIQAGYYNIPGEYLEAQQISPREISSLAHRAWVCDRVALARNYFRAGQAYLAQDKSLRRRLAGSTYTARFTWMLRTIARDHYCLRSEYPERKSLSASLWMGWSVIVSLLASFWKRLHPRVQPYGAHGT